MYLEHLFEYGFSPIFPKHHTNAFKSQSICFNCLFYLALFQQNATINGVNTNFMHIVHFNSVQVVLRLQEVDNSSSLLAFVIAVWKNLWSVRETISDHLCTKWMSTSSGISRISTIYTQWNVEMLFGLSVILILLVFSIDFITRLSMFAILSGSTCTGNQEKIQWNQRNKKQATACKLSRIKKKSYWMNHTYLVTWNKMLFFVMISFGNKIIRIATRRKKKLWI